MVGYMIFTSSPGKTMKQSSYSGTPPSPSLISRGKLPNAIPMMSPVF